MPPLVDYCTDNVKVLSSNSKMNAYKLQPFPLLLVPLSKTAISVNVKNINGVLCGHCK